MSKVQKEDIGYLDVSRNRIRADHLTGNPDVQENVKKLHKLFPNLNKDTISKVLVSVDNDLDAAKKNLMSREDTKEVLDQWEVAKGRSRGKPASATKTRKNKKSTQTKMLNGESPNDPSSNHSSPKINGYSSDSNSTTHPAPTTVARTRPEPEVEPAPLPQRPRHKKDKTSSVEARGVPTSVEEGGVPPRTQPAPSKGTSEKAPTNVSPPPSSVQTTPPGSRVQGPLLHDAMEDSNGTRSRLDSTTSTGSVGGGGDSTKRLLKDLTRCHVSLSRHRSNLNERCDASSRLIRQVFSNLRSLVDQREEALVKELEDIRRDADRVLEERKTTSGQLKAQGDSLGGKSETEASQLRAQIKAFIADRKVDEEIGSISRFQCDPDSLCQQISSFGAIVNVCHTYTSWHSGHLAISPRVLASVSSSQPPPSNAAAVNQTKVKSRPPVTTTTTNTSAVGRGPPNAEDKKESQARVRDAVIKQGVVLEPPQVDSAAKRQPSSKSSRRRNQKRQESKQNQGEDRHSSKQNQGEDRHSSKQNQGEDRHSSYQNQGEDHHSSKQNQGEDRHSRKPQEHTSNDATGSQPQSHPQPRPQPHPQPHPQPGTSLPSAKAAGTDNPSQNRKKQSSSAGQRHFEESVVIVHDKNRSKQQKYRYRSQSTKAPVDTEGDQISSANKKVNSKHSKWRRRQGRAKSQSPPPDQTKPVSTKPTISEEGTTVVVANGSPDNPPKEVGECESRPGDLESTEDTGSHPTVGRGVDDITEGETPNNGDVLDTLPPSLPAAVNVNNSSNKPPPKSNGPLEESQQKIMTFEDGVEEGKVAKVVRKQSIRITPKPATPPEELSFTLKAEESIED